MSPAVQKQIAIPPSSEDEPKKHQPPEHDHDHDHGHDQQQEEQEASSSHSSPSCHAFPHPKLRLQFGDVTDKATDLFLTSIHPARTLTKAIADVLGLLYRSPSDPTTTPPPTRSVTLILRHMCGVAYTTGIDLDDDHKEIHFALSHIKNTPRARAASEITGVLTHELVHCLQWNAEGTCPGGLIEGIADWVRLRCGLEPPHWKREVRDKWDDGYQHTAYFLDWLEHKFGHGFVRRVNEKLRVGKYHERKFWHDLTGSTPCRLYREYVEHLREEDPCSCA